MGTIKPWSSGKVGFRKCNGGHVHWDNITVTTNMGNVVSYDDYDPWGMQLADRSGNYGDANDKYKFTSKERDKETGYDYFGARYY